jgi:sugar phosphate permease
MARDPQFKGYIHDVGGPTANFHHPSCKKQLEHGMCGGKDCLFPKPCSQLDTDHTDYIDVLRAVGEVEGVKSSLKAYFGNPSALLASAGFVAVVFANNAYLSWAPKFMARKFGLSVGSAGNGTMLYHHIAAFVAIMLGAFVTDAFVKSRPRFRLGLQMSALLFGAPALFLIGFSPNVAFAWVAVAAYGVFRGLFEVNSHASLFDVVPSAHRSTAEGMMTMIAFFIGSLSPLMIGALSDKYGLRGFEIGFSVLGAGYVLGAIAIAVSFFWTFKRDRSLE